MTSPIQAKCYQCEHFQTFRIENDTVLADPKGETRILYFCPAFPDGDGIPEDILFWNEPHLTIREDQEGDFIFSPTPELVQANPFPDGLSPQTGGL